VPPTGGGRKPHCNRHRDDEQDRELRPAEVADLAGHSEQYDYRHPGDDEEHEPPYETHTQMLAEMKPRGHANRGDRHLSAVIRPSVTRSPTGQQVPGVEQADKNKDNSCRSDGHRPSVAARERVRDAKDQAHDQAGCRRVEPTFAVPGLATCRTHILDNAEATALVSRHARIMSTPVENGTYMSLWRCRPGTLLDFSASSHSTWTSESKATTPPQDSTQLS
jgi:hypothetical protein